MSRELNIDFTKILEEAQDTKERIESGGSNPDYKYRLVYPGQGSLTVRLLYNTKSNTIVRKIFRHTIGEDRVPCMVNYGYKKSECPICSALDSIYNATGSVPKGSWMQVRMVAYAQYISSSYKIDGVKEGDVVLLMGPKTLHDSIQLNINSMSSNIKSLEECFLKNESNTMVISRSADNKYSFVISPFDKFKSAQSQESFDALLDSVDNLGDAVIPFEPTDEIISKINGVGQELSSKYLGNHVKAPAPDNTKTDPAPISTNTAPSTTVATPSNDAPASDVKKCYGSYNAVQSGTDGKSRAIQVLCKNCKDRDACKIASDELDS